MRLSEAMEGKEAATLEDMLPRTIRGLRSYLNYMSPEDRASVESNHEDMLYYLQEFLNDEHGITIRGDGLIEFYQLTKYVRHAIGDLPVVLFHYTSSGVVDKIKEEGLVPGDTNVNRQFIKKPAGVYLTTEASGPVVKGYLHGARHTHGGDPVRISVRTFISDLMGDPDDEGLRSGNLQYVVPYIDPHDILEIEEYDPW
jgi:hypothetical protein